MKSRLRAIGSRRAALRAEIDAERAMLGEHLADLRNDVALAGLGLLASRLAARHRWVRRALVFGGVAAVAVRHFAARGWKPA